MGWFSHYSIVLASKGMETGTRGSRIFKLGIIRASRHFYSYFFQNSSRKKTVEFTFVVTQKERIWNEINSTDLSLKLWLIFQCKN